MKKLFFIMPHLPTHNLFKLDFPQVDQHTGGQWLIHGTKRRKDNQLYPLSDPKLSSFKITVQWEMSSDTLL